MSLSRVIIRLEIADTEDHVIKLSFDAVSENPGFKLAEVDKIANLTIAVNQHPGFGSVCLDEKQVELYKGRRPYQKITMEHYALQDDAGQDPQDSVHNPDEHVSHMDSETAEHHNGSLKSVDSVRPGSAKMWNKSSSTEVKFFSGNPSVETIEGIIHLYREDQLFSQPQQSLMICMLKVPATFSSQDLLQFIAPIEPGLEHIKIIRDGTPNQYMVLLKFKEQMYANDFYQTYNNQPFNSIEPDICHLAYVARLESLLSSQGAGLQISGATELPNCTVCLERMDESVKGILTILCNHSFHVACLAEWKDTSCPVCRCVQTPVPTADNKCFECSAQVNLWICLICGFVGCGRYVEGHAYGHFKDTSHTYSMELGSNRVWDYAGDNYVHRLVQNKADGKLVEVDERSNNVQEEKIDALNLEYTFLLTSQLESQRLYYEEMMQSVERRSQRQVEALESKAKKVMEEMAKVEYQANYVNKDKKEIAEHAIKLEQQLQLVNKEKQKLTTKLSKVTTQLADESAMNRCLRENQLKWQERVVELEDKLAKKDVEVCELRDQLRDVMFFLEAKDTLATAEGATQQEIQEGQIIMHSPGAEGSSNSTPSNKKSRSRKR